MKVTQITALKLLFMIGAKMITKFGSLGKILISWMLNKIIRKNMKKNCLNYFTKL